jgi:carbonic anhydrase/acetyltransferase-like protein (isoleucine patch superfamily)
VLVGMGAIVMDNAVVGTNSIIAAGAVVLEGTRIESGTIYGGIPARKIKDIPADLISGQIERIANHYLVYAGWFNDANAVPR